MDRRWYYILAIAFSYAVAIFGGAFASGREIVQFIGRFGAAGVWGAIVAGALFAYFGMVALITTRRWQTFDYKSYVSKLYREFLPEKAASKGYWLFEVTYLLMCMLGLGVITAALAEMFVAEMGIPYGLAITMVAGAILLVVTFGADIIRAFNFTITWALLLATIIVMAVAFGPVSGDSWRTITSGAGPGGAGWLLNAVLFVSYNLIGVIMITSLAEPLKDRTGALLAGLIGGIGIGVLVLIEYVLVMAYYPEIVDEALPLWFVCSETGSSLVRFAYDFILTGAILTTGIALTYPPVKRFKGLLIARLGAEKEALSRFLLTLMLILIGLGLSSFGLIDLVGKGLWMMGWAFIVVFLVPLLIFGSRAAWTKASK